MHKRIKILYGFIAFLTLGSSCYSQNHTYPGLGFNIEKMVSDLVDEPLNYDATPFTPHWLAQNQLPTSALSTTPEYAHPSDSSHSDSSREESHTFFNEPMETLLNTIIFSQRRRRLDVTPPHYNELIEDLFYTFTSSATSSPDYGWHPFAYLLARQNNITPLEREEYVPMPHLTLERSTMALESTSRRISRPSPAYEEHSFSYITSRRTLSSPGILPSYEDTLRPPPYRESIF